MSVKADPAFIEILIAIDACNLFKDITPGKTIDKPACLDHPTANKYIVMMVAPMSLMTSQKPDANLQIKARTNDVIRWRSASFARLSNDVLLVGFNKVSSHGVLSTAHLVPVQKYSLVQKTENPNDLVLELVTDSRWEVTCMTKGYDDYNFTFAVIEPGTNDLKDPSHAKVLGYYKFDPRINVDF